MKYYFNKIQQKNNFDSEDTKITKATGVVASATLLSRITGYIRDMVFASFFGVGMISDAFIAAFRIPNLLRRLVGEGSLSLAFVPVFTNYIAKKEYDLAYKLATRALRVLLFFLIFISLLGIILTPLILKIVTPGFIAYPLKMELTVKLTRIMFPYIVFVGMLALCMSILNSVGYFAIPAVAPVFLNLSMVGFLYFFSCLDVTNETLITGLAIGVLVGGFLQLALQLPVLVRNGLCFWENLEMWHPGFIPIGYAMLPTIFGSSVYQINIIIGTLLSSFLTEGSVACLYYADRIVQFPLGIFAYAIATAVLPSLSRQISSGDYDALVQTFERTINFLFFLTFPAMAGLIILRQPIVELLFARGVFDTQAVLLTSDALLCYTLGLWAFSAVRVVVPVFFALQDTVTPVKMAIISIIFNISLGFVLMSSLGHCGLAIATSIASIINLFLLLFVLRKRVNAISWKNILISGSKTFLCVTLMSVGVVCLKQLLIPIEGIASFSLTVSLFICIFIGIFIFLFFAFSLRMPQFTQIMILLGIAKKGN